MDTSARDAIRQAGEVSHADGVLVGHCFWECPHGGVPALPREAKGRPRPTPIVATCPRRRRDYRVTDSGAGAVREK
jgi:hypothetical protein